MIALIFYALVLGLVAIIVYCLTALKREIMPPNDSTPIEDPYFEEGIEESKQSMMKSVEIMENAPPIEEVVARSQKKAAHGLFDKLKASRTTRKQSPTSSATPAIKSLRGRKV